MFIKTETSTVDFCPPVPAYFEFISGQNINNIFEENIAPVFRCTDKEYGFVEASLLWDPYIGNQVQAAQAVLNYNGEDQISKINIIVIDKHLPLFNILESENSSEMIEDLITCYDYVDSNGSVYQIPYIHEDPDYQTAGWFAQNSNGDRVDSLRQLEMTDENGKAGWDVILKAWDGHGNFRKVQARINSSVEEVR